MEEEEEEESNMELPKAENGPHCAPTPTFPKVFFPSVLPWKRKKKGKGKKNLKKNFKKKEDKRGKEKGKRKREKEKGKDLPLAGSLEGISALQTPQNQGLAPFSWKLSHGKGLEADDPQGPSNQNHSMILFLGIPLPAL